MRAERMADEIQVILSNILLREVADPRLKPVLVTRVELTRDLRVAHVYFSTYFGGQLALDAGALALAKAVGFMRSTLGKKLGSRYVPELRFREDHSAQHAIKIEAVLSEVLPPGEPDDENNDS
jgi:ribosome-binding factor A